MLDKIYSILANRLGTRSIVDFEVYYERLQSRHYESKDLAIDAAEEAIQEGVALRVFRDGRMAFGYSTDLSAFALESLADSTTAALPYVDADPDVRLPVTAAAIAPVSDLRNLDSGLSQIPKARKLETAIGLEKAAKAVDPRVKHVRSASYEEKILTMRLKNSSGLEADYSRSRCSLGVMAVAEADSEAEGAYEFDASPFFERLDPEAVGRAAAQLALSYLGAGTPSTRRVPVVLDPLVAGEILEILAASFQGDQVFKKRSSLAGKLGERLYAPILDVVDDGLLPEGAGSSPFDGEGQPGRRLSLVQAGRISNYLLDPVYARKLGLTSNASAVRRGIQRPPSISYSNLMIPPGPSSDLQIYRDIGSGIIVTETFGMHAANPITGDFSVGMQGFLIEGGEKREPVKKLVLAGNLHQMMAQVRAVGSRHRFQGQVGAPTLAIESMSVGGT